MENRETRNKVFLSLLFTGEPLKMNILSRIAPKKEIEMILDEISGLFGREGLPLRIVQFGDGYRIGTEPGSDDFLKDFFRKEKRVRLSRAGLEVLTIIAYKQPITIPEINQIRAINSEGPIKTLLEKNMIEISGRKDSLGRPLLFCTGLMFLEAFGLKSLEDLPKPVEINMLKQGLDNEDY